MRRQSPVGTKDREANNVRRNGCGAETLHAVVVDEAASANGVDRSIDGLRRVGIDVPAAKSR